MTLTRIKTQELAKALTEALQKLDEVRALLAPYLVIATPQDRRDAVRPPESFPAAGRALCRASVEHPLLQAAAPQFEAEAVIEDLDNVDLLEPLTEKLEEMLQQIADSKLSWLSEAYLPSLAVYAVAKAMSKTNGALRTVVDPLAQIFSTARSRRTE